MSIFTKWFTGEPGSNQTIKPLMIEDEKRPFHKRQATLISYTSKLSNEKFNMRLYDFYKEYSLTVTKICVIHLTSPDPKVRLRSWADAVDDLKVLIDLARYGLLIKVEEVQEIGKICLLDSNRIELRELGFGLIINLLTHDPSLHMSLDLYQTAIDLSCFSDKKSLQFIDRKILIECKEPGWLGNIKDYLNRITPKKFSELDTVSKDIPESEPIKESILMLKNFLDFTLQGGVTPTGIDVPNHFKKWFGILKSSYLKILYPDLTEETQGLGFIKCPEILHLIIIMWIAKFLDIPEVVSDLFCNQFDRNLVIKILEKTLVWFDPDNSLSVTNTNKCFAIFEDCINEKYNIKIQGVPNETFDVIILDHLVCVFKCNTDKIEKKLEISNKTLWLFELFQKKTSEKTKIFENLLKICDIINNQIQSHEIIKQVSYFILKILKETIGIPSENFYKFIPYLHAWAQDSILLIQSWKNKIIEVSSEFSKTDFEDPEKIKYWLDFVRVLGCPLDLNPVSQSEWAASLDEIVGLLLQKNIKTVTLIKHLLPDLSKLIISGTEESQKISLDTICKLYTLRSETPPSLMYYQRLFYLLYISINRGHLEVTILNHCSKLLDCKGMHVIIKKLIEIANKQKELGIPAIFRLSPLPNHYNTTVLHSLDSSTGDYKSLKKDIFEYYKQNILSDTNQTIDGLSVFLAEEITSDCHEFMLEGMTILLNLCNNTENLVAITAIKAVSALVPLISSYNSYVLEFIVKEILRTDKFNNETLMINILDMVMFCLMNYKNSVNQETFKILFQTIANFGGLVNKESKLRLFMDIFLSFLGFYYLNYPLKGTSDEFIDSSVGTESYVPDEIYSLNGNTIISLFKDKFLIRNEFGKFLWSFKSFQIYNLETYSEDREKLKTLLSPSRISMISEEKPKLLPTSPTLELLIAFINNTYKPFQKLPIKLVYPEIEKKIKALEEIEKSYLIKNPQVNSPIVESLSKIFIANIGLLNDLSLLTYDENLERSLSLLDNIKSREQVKIGVLYIRPGQDDEKQILLNNKCSEGFNQFLNKLGTFVDLETYTGNLGGLDPKGTCGKKSLVYIDWEYEVMFHIPVLMPTNVNDEQQVLKKRHVGNDMVLIIWSENWKDYRHDTIVTHFNFISIVIYPLEERLYRIQIINKPAVEFGPLKDGMVVSWKVLPYLIRVTALNANKIVKCYKHASFEKQTIIRNKTVKDIIKNHSSSSSNKYNTTRY